MNELISKKEALEKLQELRDGGVEFVLTKSRGAFFFRTVCYYKELHKARG